MRGAYRVRSIKAHGSRIAEEPVGALADFRQKRKHRVGITSPD
jgi:hypothetical protein